MNQNRAYNNDETLISLFTNNVINAIILLILSANLSNNGMICTNVMNIASTMTKTNAGYAAFSR